jgi:hypothetical protein
MNTISEFLKSYCETGAGLYNLQKCFQGIYNLLVALAVLVAFFYFLFGAIQYMLSPIADIKGSGKSKMFGALKGLFVIFIFGAILYWVNPNIFNAKLIFFRVTALDIPVEFLEGEAKNIDNFLSSVTAYSISDGPGKCQEFFNTIDKLVDLGIGVEDGSFNLTVYTLNRKKLSRDQVRALIKATLISESGGAQNQCYPPNWGRHDIGGYFGTEKIKKNEIREALNVLKNKGIVVSVNLNDNIENLTKISGPLDKPDVVVALFIRRLYSYYKFYKESIQNFDSKVPGKTIYAALVIYKAGPDTLEDIMNGKISSLGSAKEKAIASIIKTIENA